MDSILPKGVEIMKKKLISIISAITILSTSVPTVSVAENKTLKIMPIGDSITHGYQSTGGYRKYFCYHFGSDNKYDFDMVGPNCDYPETYQYNNETYTYDSNHCGYSGYAIQYMEGTETRQGILETLQNGNYLQTYDPDIIMLQIGTNDILSAYNDGITERLENLINYISDNTNDAIIFVTTIPYIDAIEVYDWCWAYGDKKYSNTPEDFNKIINAYVDDYNESIPVLVNKLQNEGKKVQFADIYGQIEKENLLEDGVHPNETTYHEIGLLWADEIKSYLNLQSADNEKDSTEECPYRISDLVSLANYILDRNNHQITKENYSLYDINNDNTLNSFDLTLLKQALLSKKS